MRTSLLRVASFALVLGASTAHAHIPPPVVRADRTLTITLGERVSLAYVVRLSNPELSRVRREADGNRDGTISRDESDAMLASFTKALHEGVRVASGLVTLGEPVSLARAFARSTEATGLEGPVVLPEQGPGARIEWQFELPVAAEHDRLAIDDSSTFVQFDHSDVLVRDTATRRLRGLGDDPMRMRTAPELAWVDAGAGRAHRIVVTWVAPREAARGWMVMLVVLVGLAIAGATLWSVRGKSSRTAGDEEVRETGRREEDD